MGALAGLGVSLLGTAAGRTAATLAMGGKNKDPQLSKLDKIAQNNLIQVPTFGSSATNVDDLDSNLLGSILGMSDPASQGQPLPFEIASGYTTDQINDPGLPGNIEARRKLDSLRVEREQIAGRQSAFRQQIRGGNQPKILSTSRKTLLGRQL